MTRSIWSAAATKISETLNYKTIHPSQYPLKNAASELVRMSAWALDPKRPQEPRTVRAGNFQAPLARKLLKPKTTIGHFDLWQIFEDTDDFAKNIKAQ